jgi:hypothetical protein
MNSFISKERLMNTLINLISALSKNTSNTKNEENTQTIPKEILDQYPYGEFPIRYTKPGQETIRKHSENRFLESYDNKTNENNNNNTNDFNISSLLPLIQILSNKNSSNKDLIDIFSKLLFKDKPELQNLLKMFNKSSHKDIKPQEINNTNYFPETNKVNISSLKKINKKHTD